MKKFFLILMAIFFSFSLFAQEDAIPDENENRIENSTEVESAPETEDEEIEEKEPKRKETFNPFVSQFNQRGDQYVKISLMGVFPLNFGGDFPIYRDGQIAFGGSGELGYHKFLLSWLALGFDIAFGYNPTLENNMFTWVPLFLTLTVQPTFWRFEIPITVGVGGAYETYMKYNYFPGFVFKPQLGVFFRISPGWSFGLETQFMVMPQTCKNSDRNFTGLFQTLGVSARYHF